MLTATAARIGAMSQPADLVLRPCLLAAACTNDNSGWCQKPFQSAAHQPLPINLSLS